MRMLRLLMAALLAAPALPAIPAQAREMKPPRLPSACRELAKIDWARMDDSPEGAEVHVFWADLVSTARTGSGAHEPPADSKVVIRFAAPPGFGMSDPAITSTWAAKGPDGVWRMSRVDYHPQRAGMTSPPSPGEAAPEIVVRDVVEGVMAPGDAAVIEAALADRCRTYEPLRAPAALPVKGGGLETCMDGSSFLIEVTVGNQTRRSIQACTTRWSTGAIGRVLERAWPQPVFGGDG